MTCMTSHTHFPSIGAALVCLAIGLGAWAAHGLDQTITPLYQGKTKVVAGQTIPAVTKYVGDFKTAADYQLGQGLGLMLIGCISIAHCYGMGLK